MTEKELAEIETELKIKLPKEYREVVLARSEELRTYAGLHDNDSQFYLTAITCIRRVIWLIAVILLLESPLQSDEPKTITIDAAFPGGNIIGAGDSRAITEVVLVAPLRTG